jgi:hypothetical protein
VTGNITANICEVCSEFNGCTNFAAVAMEIKKGDLIFF